MRKKPEGEEIDITHTEWPDAAAGKKEEQRGRAVKWGGEEVRGEEKTDEEFRE